MEFPRDAGLSCVRYFLASDDSALSAHARSEMDTPGRLTGRLICQCGAIDKWSLADYENFVVLACNCNGSSLPLYIGQPPAYRELGVTKFLPGISCDNKIHGQFFKHRCDISQGVVIGIGYPKDVPPLGTIEVEMAQEIVIVCQCAECQQIYTGWKYRLEQPYEIQGDEPWLKYIQGLSPSRLQSLKSRNLHGRSVGL